MQLNAQSCSASAGARDSAFATVLLPFFRALVHGRLQGPVHNRRGRRARCSEVAVADLRMDRRAGKLSVGRLGRKIAPKDRVASTIACNPVRLSFNCQLWLNFPPFGAI